MPRPEVPFVRPLLIIGGLSAAERDRVRAFATKLNAPVYAEPLSGLREDPALRHLHIKAGERMIALGDFDGVVRFGGVPTLRFWRDLDEGRRDLPVISFSRVRFPGLSRGEVYPIDAFPDSRSRDESAAFLGRDAEMAAEIARILDDEPQSEQAIFRSLSLELKPRSRVYLGNSLPIREWDLFATREDRGYEYEANRGANGIDGQLSTFFGWCAPGRDNVAVIGDLTAVYDMNAPWIVPQLDEGTRFKIVIINNEGGRIFSRVSALGRLDPRVRRTIVENEHSLRFRPWAKMWNLSRAVDERLPDAEATRRVWQRYDALWS